jgi:hypothetical protein
LKDDWPRGVAPGAQHAGLEVVTRGRRCRPRGAAIAPPVLQLWPIRS